jgi:hypothetical protein
MKAMEDSEFFFSIHRDKLLYQYHLYYDSIEIYTDQRFKEELYKENLMVKQKYETRILNHDLLKIIWEYATEFKYWHDQHFFFIDSYLEINPISPCTLNLQFAEIQVKKVHEINEEFQKLMYIRSKRIKELTPPALKNTVETCVLDVDFYFVESYLHSSCCIL